MKPLLLNTSDIIGGAARAAYRLHQGLKNIGVDSQMLVQNKQSDDYSVIAPVSKLSKGIGKLTPTLDSIPLQIYPQRDRSTYSVQWLLDNLAAQVAQINPDVINLHWINGGYLKIETIAKFNKPIVWTLHDMWAFTGGCHYNGDCMNYTNSCGTCPQLHSNKEKDLSRWIWQRKTKAWQNLNLTIVTPSHWLAKCAASSSLLKDVRIEVIPNGLDTKQYKPIEKSVARSILGLPEDKQLILFGAMSATSDPRKGFNFLQSALQNLSQSGWRERVELVVFGASQPKNPTELGFKSHYLGRLNDDISLSLVYAAADVFLAPSVQDNLPNTVMESLACGTPCVAFDIGGMPDMIEHQQNGYLAKAFDIEDLARGIAWVLEDKHRWVALSQRGREKVENDFTVKAQAEKYISLYQSLIPNKK
ncbi:glycosyltransferase family 4 protein [Anabaena sp. AL09]|uniref:glycosyltransferase family 4 protein n=1 Tax=Anabaena sp. AL09 TaxID=1710891 RepID=UPI0007FF31EB|nr:glycosyltransferase family 4 protein [Anabaena sp. AL09]OBQ01968.1 MAG: glycosyl transferase [Anabaena sp. AL09]